MRARRIEGLAWLLIYVGLFGLCLGWFVGRSRMGLGSGVMLGGVLTAVAGALLIYVRSRMADDPDPAAPPAPRQNEHTRKTS